jgi:hypothetical protein
VSDGGKAEMCAIDCCSALEDVSYDVFIFIAVQNTIELVGSFGEEYVPMPDQ